MGQKINPYSFRLGLFLNWKAFFQCYGTLPNQYSWLLFNKQLISVYIKLFIESKYFYLNYSKKTFKVFHTLCNTYFLNKPLRHGILNIFYSNFKVKLRKYTLLNDLVDKKQSLGHFLNLYFYRSLLFWNQNALFLNVYKYNWFFNSQSILHWVKTNLKLRLRRHSVPVQQVLRVMFSTFFINYLNGFLLKDSYRKPIVISNLYGNFKYLIIGFKIKCKGWLKRSKRRRSSQVKWKLGNLPLHTLSNYIDYAQDIFLTRAGVVGIKVWLNLKLMK